MPLHERASAQGATSPYPNEDISPNGTDLTQLRRNRRLAPRQRVEKMLQIRKALTKLRGMASSGAR